MELRFDLEHVGWAVARVSHGEQEASLTASYLGDALPDLLTAVDDVLAGAGRARASWCEEPGTFTWTLTRAGDDLRVHVAWRPSSDPGETVFDATCPLADAAAGLAAGARSTLERYGEVDYWDRWDHPFPVDRLRSVERRLAGGRPGPVVAGHPPRTAVAGGTGALGALARALGTVHDDADPDASRALLAAAVCRPYLDPLLLRAVAEEPDLRVAVGTAVSVLERGGTPDPGAWADAVPAPGRERVRERARDVATLLAHCAPDAAATPEDVATWSDWLQHRLVGRTPSHDVLRRLEAHGRERSVRRSARARLDGPRRPVPRADEYAGAPLRFHQAAALVLATRWYADVRLADAEVDRLLDHLWDLVTVDPGATCPDDSPGCEGLAASVAAELPDRLRSRAERRSVPVDVLGETLADLVVLACASRTAADPVGSQDRLRDLETRLAPWELVLPPRADLDAPPSSTHPESWDAPSPAELALWRTLAERPRRLRPR